MTHIGLVTPAYVGHVNTMTTLARELRRRGHRVTLISTPDGEQKAARAGLAFAAVGQAEYPVGSLERFTAQQGRLSGMAAVRLIIRDLTGIAKVMVRDLPPLVREHGIDALVVDQVVPAGNIVAEHLDIPFVNVCSFMPLNSEPDVPPVMTTFPYRDSPAGRVRNRIGYGITSLAMRPLVKVVNDQRIEWGMRPVSVDGVFSDLAQIAQQPAFFDFPRKRLPACFHYTGPFHDEQSDEPVPFPWERLDGRPLVYASMGTLQNRMMNVYRIIAEAVARLDVQLVLAYGRRDLEVLADLPGNPIAVGYAPQLELLARASLVVNHAGTNTVLESLAHGLPMVSLPVALDQLGVAARVKYLGVGEFIPVTKVTAKRLRSAVERLGSDPSYRVNARVYQQKISELDGPRQAAEIIEEAFRTGRPVLARCNSAVRPAP